MIFHQFARQRLAVLTDLINMANDALKALDEMVPESQLVVVNFLDAASTALEDLNDPGAENEILVVKADYDLARRGVNSLASHEASGRRHDVKRAAAFRALRVSSELLRNMVSTLSVDLEDGQQRVADLLELAIGEGVIENIPYGASSDQLFASADFIWSRLLGGERTRPAALTIALRLSAADIRMHLADFVGAMISASSFQIMADGAHGAHSDSATPNPTQ